MSVIIQDIVKGSYADLLGIKSGSKLLSINGNEIRDVLDYRFYETNKQVVLKIEENGKKIRYSILKAEYESIGLSFSTYLMDEEQHCKNKCIFCFIDQLPPHMRKTLYFKDDDARLSFLMGNYITLTNLDEREINRIIKMHISPVNVSVHTTNPELRVKMMGNPKAGEVLDILKKFVSHGIKVNCQIVLCPGINDGSELKRTISDLLSLGDNAESIACVPVGLTKYRQKLYPLKEYDKASATETLDIIEAFGEQEKNKSGIRKVYASDEFYLKAERKIPDESFYEDFPQIENGVGLIADLKSSFEIALEDFEKKNIKREVSLATGEAAYDFMCNLSSLAEAHFEGLKCHVYKIKNDFFGGGVNVAGLLTGSDYYSYLKDKNLGEALVISKCSLKRDEDVFLDDMTLKELEEKLKVAIYPVNNDGYELLKTLTGEDR